MSNEISGEHIHFVCRIISAPPEHSTDEGRVSVYNEGRLIKQVPACGDTPQLVCSLSPLEVTCPECRRSDAWREAHIGLELMDVDERQFALNYVARLTADSKTVCMVDALGCPSCGGNGYVYHMVMDEYGREHDWEAQCSTCGGSGYYVKYACF